MCLSFNKLKIIVEELTYKKKVNKTGIKRLSKFVIKYALIRNIKVPIKLNFIAKVIR